MRCLVFRNCITNKIIDKMIIEKETDNYVICSYHPDYIEDIKESFRQKLIKFEKDELFYELFEIEDDNEVIQLHLDI